MTLNHVLSRVLFICLSLGVSRHEFTSKYSTQQFMPSSIQGCVFAKNHRKLKLVFFADILNSPPFPASPSMFHVSDPIIQNVKIGIRFDVARYDMQNLKKRATCQCENISNYHNFSVLRSVFVYSIFWNCGYINITKIPSTQKIEKAISHILLILGINSSHLEEKHIHNICASGAFSKNLDLTKIKNQLSQREDLKVRRNLSTFLALFVKVIGTGTCVLFQNGKYSLVGVKTEQTLAKLIAKIALEISKNGL